MNIAIFTNNYLPNPYGVSGSVESFRHEFEKRGHKVYIFAPRYKEYKDENSYVFRYPALDIKIKIRFPLAIPYSWKMDQVIKNLKLDIIHAQHPNLLGRAAAKWAHQKKIPLVFTWHTLYDRYVNFVPFLPQKLSIWYIIKNAVNFANQANAVIVPTDSIIPIIKTWGVKNKNITPIATGIDEVEFAGADGQAIRKKYGFAEDEKVLLLVSRLTAEKNVEFVFRAVKDILKTGQAKFLVVGDGYLASSLKEFCAREGIVEKVIFTGEVARKEMKNYYAAGDIFVYASESETQGMIITEAMYLGLPIVTLSATGINSLVLNNGNGFLVSDEKEFQAAIEKLLEDTELYQKFSETSGRIARSQFTSEVCAKKMLNLYETVIHKKATRRTIR